MQVPANLIPDSPLDRFTTIRVGGTADYLCEPASSRAVVEVLRWAAQEGLPIAVVGKGSNLVVDDAGFRGVVLHLRGALEAISVRGIRVICGGGASFPRAVLRAANHGLSGMEFGASIPGTTGGAVVMNAGAYGGEVKDVLEWAVVCTDEGRRRMSLDELAFAYRTSAVTRRQVVTLACFQLHPGERNVIDATLADYRRHRRSTQPQGVRTFGSVFTNPPNDSAGRLIEQAGCKSLTIGGARISPIHANFIEASAGCSSADVLALIAEARRRVHAGGGPLLEPEVRYLHPTDGIRRAAEELA